MYVKVHKIKDQWFRVDNGALVGDAVTPGNLLTNLLFMYGSEKKFAKMKGNIIIIYYGYFNGNIFHRFCKKSSCVGCHPQTKNVFCYKSAGWRPSSGYYIKTAEGES